MAELFIILGPDCLKNCTTFHQSKELKGKNKKAAVVKFSSQ